MTSLGEMARHLMAGSESREASCARHGAYTSRSLWLFDTVDWSGCPSCLAERETERKAADVRARALRRLERAGVPLRFMGKRFEDYRATTREQRIALLTATDYAERFAVHGAEGRCLLFAGQPGTGKTHLALAILKRVIADGRSGRYVRAFELIEAIRATWRKDADRREADALADYTSVDLLVLDEVGVQYGTEGEVVELFKVLDTRYLDLKPTVIIGNVDRDDLQRYLGERAVDRLRESGGKFIAFDWPSERPAI
jgi:DNA replication protein DnaC